MGSICKTASPSGVICFICCGHHFELLEDKIVAQAEMWESLFEHANLGTNEGSMYPCMPSFDMAMAVGFKKGLLMRRAVYGFSVSEVKRM